jgi:hypothetical protein
MLHVCLFACARILTYVLVHDILDIVDFSLSFM